MSSDENRSKLRLIAIKSGLLEKIELAKSLRWSEEDLLAKLEGTYEDCRKWSSEDIDSIISDLSSGKKRQPVKKEEPENEENSEESSGTQAAEKPAKRRRRSSKAEPTVETVEAKDLDTKDLTAEGNVKKRQPASRKKREPVVDGEPKAAVFQVDGKALIEEFGLADVKDQVVSNQALLAGLTVETEDIKTSLESLTKQLDSIEKMLVWFYNSETDDNITKLSQVFK